jgi:hypothetical protein
MKYYRGNTSPLIALSEDHVKAGDIVYNELGKLVKKIYVGEDIYFIEVLESVLNEGETMSELTPLQLELFWKLSNNKLKKYEDQNKDPRRYLLS